MPAWDYEMVWSGDDGLSGVRRQIRELAAEGWEVQSTCAVTGVFVVVLRRPVAGAAQADVEADLDLTVPDRWVSPAR